MNLREIKELSIHELMARKLELREEGFHLRIQQQSGQLEKPSQLRTLRREVAQLETFLSRKSRLSAPQSTKS